MNPIKVLLQTTIVPSDNDWSVARFGLLAKMLMAQRGEGGEPMFEVTARDRETRGAPDPVLATLDRSDFDEMWLFAVDTGEGLLPEDIRGINAFRGSGRGLLVTRDHMDLGCCVCALDGVGAAHHFHTRNVEPLPGAQRDDPYTLNISWPNIHTGANGDFQEIRVVGEIHPVLQDGASPGGAIRHLPSHPHEGAISAPAGFNARVIAQGRSAVTGRSANLAVAFEATATGGRAIAQSTFHHFADYNWDPRIGCPSFVEEAPGDAMMRVPAARAAVELYARNVASWLGGKGPNG